MVTLETANKFNKAKEHYQKNEYQEGLRLIEEVVKEEPNLPEALFLKACLQYHVFGHEVAFSTLSTALEFEPDNLRYLFWKGRIEYTVDKYYDAIETLNKILAIDPYDRESLKVKALSQYYVKDYKGAYVSINRIGLQSHFFQGDADLKDIRKKVIDSLGDQIHVVDFQVSPDSQRGSDNSSAVPDPLTLLKTRLVRGEISEEEYIRMKGLIS